MSTWGKRIEVTTNLAILFAFVLVGALAAKRLREPSQFNAAPSVGETVSLPGIQWSKSERNLVLALSTNCHFCTDSAEFYQQLIPSAAKAGVRVVAVLPQPIPDTSSYLGKLHVSVQDVVQSPLIAVEVSGTPTILMIDGTGKIRKAWVGKLTPDQEQQVIADLR